MSPLIWSDPTGTQYHVSEQLRTPAGPLAQIDVAMIPLIQALWYADFTTITCCQDTGESIGALHPRMAAYRLGQAMLELPPGDASRLAVLAAAHGFPMRWTDDGAWEMSMPLVVLPSGKPWIPSLVQVYFPASQLDAVTGMARAEALRVRGGQ